MATDKKQALTIASAINLDDRTALHLTQAFNQETDLPSLLQLLFSQLQALSGAHGLTYGHSALEFECQLGQTAHHNAEYDLEFGQDHLGSLTIFYLRRQIEPELQTSKDLVALMFTALRNAVTLMQARQTTPTPQMIPAPSDIEQLSREEKADTLVLMALDSHIQLVEQAGHEWAQILMASVHTHIKEGLRQADGVYQISDELIAILLPNTTPTQASQVAKKVRLLVASLHLTSVSTQEPLSASMGIADGKLANTAEDVMAHAKLALAQAKQEGHSTICVYTEALGEANS